MTGVHPLDTPAWHSLVSTHAALALGDSQARRYPDDVAVFAGYEPTTDGVALTALLAPDRVALLVGQPVPVGCVALGGGDGYQLVLDRLRPAKSLDELFELGPGDHAEMAELVSRTQPGPWATRTPLLGTYLGVRRSGVLVAMAGERFRPPGYTEISAVCTDDSVRRQGLASAVCTEVARRILARGETPFLHVHIDNVAALPVYEKLGFVHRRLIPFTAVRPA